MDHMISLDFETMLEWHLKHNHYPPAPLILMDACRDAISLAQSDAWDEMVDLPEGMLYNGSPVASAQSVVDAFHLEDFVAFE